MNELLLAEYYDNDARKLHQIVDKILLKFGGKKVKDYEDFYSIANETMCKVIKSYDGVRDFGGLLYSALENQVMTEFTKRNCIKRGADRETVSISTPISEDLTIEDCLESNVNEIMDMFKEETMTEKTKKYFSLLSDKQRELAYLIMDGYDKSRIMELMDLTEDDYNFYYNQMTSYDYKKVFMENDVKGGNTYVRDNTEKEKMKMESMEKIGEKSKNTVYVIRDVIDMVAEHTLRDDHILQRPSGQWSHGTKGELISDILQERMLPPIIVSQEIMEGQYSVDWLIDGLQRCSTIIEYSNDAFEIYRNVAVPFITYQEVSNENGKISHEMKEFDIRGKKFSQLPKALQNRFMRYNLPVMLSLNCTKEEIAYDMARYNRSRPMTVAQLGVLEISENIGDIINNILKLDFFNNRQKSSYTENDFRASNMKRMIIESVMVIYYFDDWKKNVTKIAKFLSENETDFRFIEFFELLKRLDVVADKKTAKMFNNKNSFIYFALFNYFVQMNTGLDDSVFIDFLVEFQNSMRDITVNGITYNELDKKSNKDKSTIVGKRAMLEGFLNDYINHLKSNIA